MQRTAQKCNAATDRLTAGQARNGLVHNRLENRRSQVRLGGALVDQGLNIGLGKHTAAGGDGVDDLIIPGRFVQARGVGLQQRSHLVDERTGAAGADAVHPLFQAALKINNLGVLTAQLNGHVGLRSGVFQSGGHRHHLLDKADAKGLPQIDRAGAGNTDPKPARTKLLPRFLQQSRQRLLGLGHVTAVHAKNHFLLLI